MDVEVLDQNPVIHGVLADYREQLRVFMAGKYFGKIESSVDFHAGQPRYTHCVVDVQKSLTPAKAGG